MPNFPFSFRGIIVPVFTPFDGATLRVNLSDILRYAKYLADRGIKGVLVNGTIGEGVTMSLDERKSVAEAWAEAVKITKQHLMIQIGGGPYPDVLELARHAEAIKADSMLCLPEMYYKPTENRHLVIYLKRVGAVAPNTPLLYYHIPKFTKVNLHMGQFLESIGDEIPTFVGIKFTSTNLEEGSHAVRADSGRFIIFLGSDQIMTAGFAIGMNSFITMSANLFPELCLKIVEACEKGDAKTAKEKQEYLSKMDDAIWKYGNVLQTMKAAMCMVSSINVGPTRFPGTKLLKAKLTDLKNDLRIFDIDIN